MALLTGSLQRSEHENTAALCIGENLTRSMNSVLVQYHRDEMHTLCCVSLSFRHAFLLYEMSDLVLCPHGCTGNPQTRSIYLFEYELLLKLKCSLLFIYCIYYIYNNNMFLMKALSLLCFPALINFHIKYLINLKMFILLLWAETCTNIQVTLSAGAQGSPNQWKKKTKRPHTEANQKCFHWVTIMETLTFQPKRVSSHPHIE